MPPGPPQSGCSRTAPISIAATAKSRGSSGALRDRALGDAPVDQAGDEAERAGVDLARARRGSPGATPARKSARCTCWISRACTRSRGQAPPAHGDDVAQHRLERPLGVELLERGVGAGVPVGGEPGIEVVLRREVPIDGALGVFGAIGDLLDRHRLPVLAVEQRRPPPRAAPARAGGIPVPSVRSCSNRRSSVLPLARQNRRKSNSWSTVTSSRSVMAWRATGQRCTAAPHMQGASDRGREPMASDETIRCAARSLGQRLRADFIAGLADRPPGGADGDAARPGRSG